MTKRKESPAVYSRRRRRPRSESVNAEGRRLPQPELCSGETSATPSPCIPPSSPPTQSRQPPSPLTSSIRDTTTTSSITINPQRSSVTSSELRDGTATSSNTKSLQRPGTGTQGSPCKVVTNYVSMRVPGRKAFEYEVTFRPYRTSKALHMHLLKKILILDEYTYAYDGGEKLYTTRELPDKCLKMHLVRHGEITYHITVQSSRPAPWDLQLESLNSIFKTNLSLTCTTRGDSFFNDGWGKTSLKDGAELWNGLRHTVHEKQIGLVLNLDVCKSTFLEPVSVIDCLEGHIGCLLTPESFETNRKKIESDFHGRKVNLTFNSQVRSYKIKGFSTVPVNALRTKDDLPLVDFLSEMYKQTLSRTDLPAIITGDLTNPSHLPLELCQIAKGQRYFKALTTGHIESRLQMAGICKADSVVAAFGINIGDELVSVDARVLSPPKLRLHSQDNKTPTESGTWDMAGEKLLWPAEISSWECLNLSPMTTEVVKAFCTSLINECSEKGMVVVHGARANHEIHKVNSLSTTSVLSKIREINLSQRQDGQLLMIILLPGESNGDKKFYGLIKRECDIALGVTSQCLSPQRLDLHLKKKINGFLENLVLKINLKLGGTNFTLNGLGKNKVMSDVDTPVIIFGADVTHHGKDGSLRSIAAVVASRGWPEVERYEAILTHQPTGVEIIEKMKESVKEHLTSFMNGNVNPKRVIFYRDGVSDGMFGQVMSHEVEAIKEAFAELNYQTPLITFIVVKKRHRVRLFPADPSSSENGNVLPGTIVDTQICEPSAFDFYLCSHVAREGTSRPALYHVLLDENNFTADELQELSFHMCFTFPRCTNSVSIVTPVLYAHYAASRSRLYVTSNDVAIPQIHEKFKRCTIYL